MRNKILKLAIVVEIALSLSVANAKNLQYECSKIPLTVTFPVLGKHYNGSVYCGNLFLQTDIPVAPAVQWSAAKNDKLYTLMMLDFDGNANGSWPDPVSPGKNTPVRHWIVGNIPGRVLSSKGYSESTSNSTAHAAEVQILQPYRAPHIPVVSDRYGVYLFEQKNLIHFSDITGPVTNFDYHKFLKNYQLGEPVATNFFTAIYISKSPFEGKNFQGQDVSSQWHKHYGSDHLIEEHYQKSST